MHPAGNMDQWVERRLGAAAPSLRLFCFPYAGGGASIYRTWPDDLPRDVEVCAIQLPGRERRLSEPPLRSLQKAVEILIGVLQPYLDLPFALFGHSMGALLAYEVARLTQTTSGLEPRGLFVSGHRAPHMPSRKRNLHDLPHEEVIAEVKALNGTPAEVFEHQDLVDLIMPMLRGDLELVETYSHPEGQLLSCPVIAMGGTRDPDVLPEELAGWRSVTNGPFKTMLFDGDHFYLNSARSSLLQAVQRELTTTAGRR